MGKHYRVVITQKAKLDIKNKKQYIIEKFKYRSYAENYANNIKEAIRELDSFPAGYRDTGFNYKGYDIFIKPQSNNLIFYTINEEDKVVTVLRVLQDGMDWENIIQKWIEYNS